MELTFAILGFCFGVIGFVEASMCLVKMQQLKNSKRTRNSRRELNHFNQQVVYNWVPNKTPQRGIVNV